jgi:anti-sigma factor (TIGR02949 family)
MSEPGCGGGVDSLSCEEVRDRLWDFIDGELVDHEAAAVQRHLEKCGRCYPEYDWNRAYAEFVRGAGQRMVPPGLRRRVFEALLEESRGRGSSPGNP